MGLLTAEVDRVGLVDAASSGTSFLSSSTLLLLSHHLPSTTPTQNAMTIKIHGITSRVVVDSESEHPSDARTPAVGACVGCTPPGPEVPPEDNVGCIVGEPSNDTPDVVGQVQPPADDDPETVGTRVGGCVGPPTPVPMGDPPPPLILGASVGVAIGDVAVVGVPGPFGPPPPPDDPVGSSVGIVVGPRVGDTVGFAG